MWFTFLNVVLAALWRLTCKEAEVEAGQEVISKKHMKNDEVKLWWEQWAVDARDLRATLR